LPDKRVKIIYDLHKIFPQNIGVKST
jgi:hypothetical protein